MRLRCQAARGGISILEVMAAFTVFFVSFVALSELVNLSMRQASLVQQRELAALLCQSKLAEVVAGAIPLSGTEATVDEDPSWNWELQCEQDGQVTGLWNVRVRVHRTTPDGFNVECVLHQMVLDPTLRGSTMDSTAITGTDATTTGGTTSGTTTGTGGTP